MEQKKGYWLEDPSIPQDEIDEIDAALAEVAKKAPRWAKLIWKRKQDEKPCLEP